MESGGSGRWKREAGAHRGDAPRRGAAVNQPLPDDQQDEGIKPREGGAVHPPQAVTSSPTEVRDLLQRGSVPISSTRAYPSALSAGRAAAQMSRASLRVRPTLGPLKRAMNNTIPLYKFLTRIPCCIPEKAGISSNNILKAIFWALGRVSCLIC